VKALQAQHAGGAVTAVAVHDRESLAAELQALLLPATLHKNRLCVLIGQALDHQVC
jgi:hypothetical protein